LQKTARTLPWVCTPVRSSGWFQLLVIDRSVVFEARQREGDSLGVFLRRPFTLPARNRQKRDHIPVGDSPRRVLRLGANDRIPFPQPRWRRRRGRSRIHRLPGPLGGAAVRDNFAVVGSSPRSSWDSSSGGLSIRFAFVRPNEPATGRTGRRSPRQSKCRPNGQLRPAGRAPSPRDLASAPFASWAAERHGCRGVALRPGSAPQPSDSSRHRPVSVSTPAILHRALIEGAKK
jgi:hypothetical protein